MADMTPERAQRLAEMWAAGGLPNTRYEDVQAWFRWWLGRDAEEAQVTATLTPTDILRELYAHLEDHPAAHVLERAGRMEERRARAEAMLEGRG